MTKDEFNPYRPIMGFMYNQVMFNMKMDMILGLFNQYPESDLVTAIVLAFFGHQITDPDVLESFRESRSRLKQSGKQKMKMLGMAWEMLFSAQKKIPQLKREIIDQNRGDISGPMEKMPLEKKFDFLINQAVVNFADAQVHNATLGGSTITSMSLGKMLKSDDDQATTDDINLLLSHCNDVVSAEIPVMLRNIAKAIENKDAFVNLSDNEALEVLRGKDGKETGAVKHFNTFLNSHGHRGHREIDPFYLPFKKNPIPCVQVVKVKNTHT